MTIHGFIPYAELAPFYTRAALLLCTSDWEGYPNTFMEAWSRGVPVVSTIDPDNVITTHATGRRITTDETLIADTLTAMLADETAWRQYAERARSFFLETHTPEAAGATWFNLLCELVTR